MTTFNVVALSAGLSAPSSTRMLVDAVIDAANKYAQELGHEVHSQVFELRDLATDVTRVMVTGMPQSRVEETLDALEGADGVIAVSPVFAGSYSGIFKSFMDLVGTERLDGTPVFLGATGGSARHSLVIDHAMRPLFATLHSQVTATGVFAATADFGSSWQGQNASGMAKRVQQAAQELVNLMVARQSLPQEAVSREKKTKPTTMEALLKSDGTGGRLRPDEEGFLPMSELVG